MMGRMTTGLPSALTDIAIAHDECNPPAAAITHIITFEHAETVLATFESTTPIPAPAKDEQIMLYGTMVTVTQVVKTYEADRDDANKITGPLYLTVVHVDLPSVTPPQ